MIERTSFKCLDNCFIKINRKTEIWDYYTKRNSNNDIYPIKNAYLFIKKYFTLGGKESLIDYLERDIKNIEEFRYEHTVLVFLLGIYFYENVPSIKNKIQEKMQEDKDKRAYLYTWFLCCLYHDIGYAYENDKNNAENNIDDYLGDFENICSELEYYDLAKKYFNYKKTEFGECDHGIVGGLILYKQLRSIYCDNTIHKDGLIYDESDYKLHKIAANAIIRHNMWTTTDEETIRKYKKYKLDELISGEKINIDEPFLFLLCLCDTIEPYKKFSKLGISSECIYKNFYICIIDNRIYLKNDFTKITIDKIKYNEFNNMYYEYVKGIDGLSEWIDLEVFSSTEMRINVNKEV